VKIYVTAVEELSNKERHDETQFTTKISGRTSLGTKLVHFVTFTFAVPRLMPYYAK
jgi:hypothetical protein